MKTASNAPGDIYYFAYGSNMAVERLQSRLPAARKTGRAILTGYCLQFHKVGKDGSGKCDIVPQQENHSTVHGVLYQLPTGDLGALDRIEGCGHGYKRARVTVAPESGELLAAETYVATAVNSALQPFCWYKQHVLRGAISGGLPAAYIDSIESVVCVEDSDRERHARELSIYK